MSINATVAKCISPNTIGIWILNDNDSFFKSEALLPRSDTTLSPILANYTSYMFPPAEYATNCNGLQQTTMDCNRLQWTAIDCNRLQQSQSYHLYKSHVPLCRVYNGLWTDCNRLQQSQYYHVYNTNSLPCRTRNPLQPTTTHCTRLQPTATHCNCPIQVPPRRKSFIYQLQISSGTLTRCCTARHRLWGPLSSFHLRVFVGCFPWAFSPSSSSLLFFIL